MRPSLTKTSLITVHLEAECEKEGNTLKHQTHIIRREGWTMRTPYVGSTLFDRSKRVFCQLLGASLMHAHHGGKKERVHPRCAQFWFNAATRISFWLDMGCSLPHIHQAAMHGVLFELHRSARGLAHAW